MEETTNNSENTFNKEEFNSFVKEALSQIKKINTVYEKFFSSTEGKASLISDIEKELNSIKQGYEDLFKNNESGVSKVSELNTKLENIRAFHKELLEGDSSIKSDVKESQDKITDFYVYLFGGSDGVEGQEKKIKESIGIITNFHSDLTKEDGYKKAIENAHAEIIKFHGDLYSKNEQGENKFSELNKAIENIKGFDVRVKTETVPFLDDTERDIKTKQSEINSLLSNATIRTLAQGYLESMQNHGFTGLKNTQDIVVKLNKESLSICISTFLKWAGNLSVNLLNYFLFTVPLLVIGLIFVEPKFVKDFLEVQSLGGANLIGMQYVFYKISVSLPLLWISWYGQRSIYHRKRLFEEYNHKLRVVQMYLLFISKDKSYDLKDIARLEKILLDIIERNPAEVYGKDETMLDKIIEAVKAYKGIVSEVSKKVTGSIDQN